MIPFSPHPSSGEAYKNSPVKWRSLTHLVQSRRSSTAELARNASHRRSQSTSAITPPHLRPPERRGSVEEKPRKSSLSGLIELKRFLPAAVQKTLSSSNSSLTQGESAGKRDQSRHQQGAKERVRRIKEHTAQPSGIHEGAASHRFEKQVRKSSVSAQQPQSAAPRANAPCGLTGDERSARPDPNQRNRPSLPERFIDDEAECVADSSGPQEVNVDVKFEVAPQSQAEYRRLSDFHEQPDQPPAPGTTQDHPTPQKGASHRTFLTSESTGQEAVIQLVFESRLPSTALAATRQPLTTPTVGASHLEQELSLKLDKTLQQTVESLVKTLSNLCPTPSPPAPSTPIPPPPEPRKKSHKRRDRKRRKHRDVAEPEEESQAPSEASLYVRRHTLPDMTVATYGMVICGTDDLHHRYRGRIEKVKFGVPISEAFSHDIPATLLVLLLKVNKEGPLKKDIWRAPGNQAQVRKLSHIMQHGRLVNISHISVYTAASVIKKFLSKLPGGIFGAENEQLLFSIMQQPDAEQQRLIFCRAISSLSIPSQHLLVLLFGTFRIIADNAETFNTRMSADAIGISVAPSLFHTCIHDGQRAKLEDVMRFKLASQVISTIIKSFGCTNLFPRECYEFYARITGRTLHVDDDWNFTFQYPSRTFSQPEIYPSRDEDKELDEEEDQPGPSGLQKTVTRQHHTDPAITEAENSDVEEEDVYSEYLPAYQSTSHSARGRASSSGGQRFRKQDSREFADLTEQHRLSSSLGEVMLSRPDEEFEVERRRLCLTTLHGGADSVESTRSLTYLEWVHEKQTKRMRTRSEWFLSPVMPQKNNGNSKSVDFETTRFTVTSTSTRVSPMRLKIPDQEMNLLSSSEEMRTVSSLTSSHSPASSVEQQQPSPMPVDSDQEEKKDKIVPLALSATGETTPRLPFQMIQHQSGDDDDAPIVATPPARQQPPVFFAGDVEGAPKLKSQNSSSSSSNQSQSSIIHQSPASTTAPPGLSRVSSMGVVRRKSWRTHYVRPNKSLDQEGTPKEKDVTETSHSTPIRYPSSTSMRRASATEAETPEPSKILIRRKSSGSSVKSKVPIQARKSTQI